MNICGLCEWKLSDDVLGTHFKKFDIILLQETWSAAGDEFHLDGYTFFNFPRKYRHKLSIRNSGGLGVFLRHEFSENVKVIKYTEDILVWLKLDKNFFGSANDLYVANIYIVPETSVYSCHDVFHILQDNLEGFPTHSDFLVCGDYNARTNVVPDFIGEFSSGNDGDLPIINSANNKRSILIREMAENGNLKRFSKDEARTNRHGNQLIELCKSIGLLIINGRVGQDKGIGNFTRVDTTGRSTVDYMICNPEFLSIIHDFMIEPKFPESDHCGLSIKIHCKARNTSNVETSYSDWASLKKYRWSSNALLNLNYVMNDAISEQHREEFLAALSELKDTDLVAELFSAYLSQAVDRVCTGATITNRAKSNGAPWFDRECRDKRSIAIKAGHRVECDKDKENQIKACKDYRAHKQRKRRQYYNNCTRTIVDVYESNRSDVWKTIERLSKSRDNNIGPSDDDFFKYFKDMADIQLDDSFNTSYESIAIDFLHQYDTGGYSMNISLENSIINDNISVTEVEGAIDYLKNNKSPGIDSIPAEFVKSCKSTLSSDITLVLNYIIGLRDFPKIWTEGLRSSVFKSGSRLDTGNYRGITILPIIEKIFEIIVYRRLSFANDAFDKKDKYNGGFLAGCRTADNIFILQGLVKRQLSIGSNLVVCFVDFAKAFDLINRHILFYKIMKCGWHGPVIDTLRNLYSKTSFRVKNNGRVSSMIFNKLGVNQGGVASGLLFRKYMSDLKTYLSTAHGICMSNEIIAHLLWADDLILFSDTFKGLQIQLDGLKQFCSNNHMIVNEIKTKIMVFGNPKRSKIHFNSVDIDEVTDYKYLGNIISSTRLPNQDPLKKTYKFLSDQARKAIFSMSHKIKSIGELPIEIMFNLFDVLIKPILIYGSDVWGLRSELWGTIDKVFLQYSRCMLHVKATTNNIITVGECGRFPPSTYCQISALCYLNRLHNMESNQLAKKIFCDLVELDQQGFNTWATDASKLVNDLRLDVTNDKNSFFMNCKRAIQNKFKTTWITHLQNTELYPRLRTYRTIKYEYIMEPYLYLVKKRHDIVKLSRNFVAAPIHWR